MEQFDWHVLEIIYMNLENFKTPNLLLWWQVSSALKLKKTPSNREKRHQKKKTHKTVFLLPLSFVSFSSVCLFAGLFIIC